MLKIFSNLQRQFSRWSEDEGTYFAKIILGTAGVHQLQDWQREGGSFSSSGLCTAKNIFTLKDRRNGLLLNGSWVGVRFLFKRIEDGLNKSEFTKCHYTIFQSLRTGEGTNFQ